MVTIEEDRREKKKKQKEKESTEILAMALFEICIINKRQRLLKFLGHISRQNVLEKQTKRIRQADKTC